MGTLTASSFCRSRRHAKICLSIITATTRLNNIVSIFETVSPGIRFFNLRWLVIIDGSKCNGSINIQFPRFVEIRTLGSSSLGYDQKNIGIDLATKPGWVFFLDDDNLIHPQFFNAMHKNIVAFPSAKGFIFQQQFIWPPGDKKVQTRQVGKDKVKVCQIDQAQFLLHTDILDNVRYETMYAGDGKFIENIFRNRSKDFVFINEVLSYYNWMKVKR